MKRNTVLAGSFIFLTLFLSLLTVNEVRKNNPQENPSDWVVLTANTDSDNDGVPNWQEEVAKSNPYDSQSFPYNKERALAQNISVDELLYPSPGTFTEEIIVRFLKEREQTAITEKEAGVFVGEVSNYFREAIYAIELPDTSLQIDDTVDRKQVLRDFVQAMQILADAGNIIPLIHKVFVKDLSIDTQVRETITVCQDGIALLPKTIPSDIEQNYRPVFNRIVYVCEALNVIRNEVTTENYFYVLRLLSLGELFAIENYLESPSTSSKKKFEKYILDINATLKA